MKSKTAEPPRHEVRIHARLDRRRAEGLGLELRRRIVALGFAGVGLVVTPAHAEGNARPTSPD